MRLDLGSRRVLCASRRTAPVSALPRSDPHSACWVSRIRRSERHVLPVRVFYWRLSWGRVLNQPREVLSAASTRSARNGILRRRTPVASYTAFPTAANIGLQAPSPPP